MLDEKELDKLCYGCIVYAEVYDSAGVGPAGPHYGIILNKDDEIKNFKRNPTYSVVVISHNDVIDPNFLMDVPARTGLDGKIVGSWITPVAEAGMLRVHHKLSVPEMIAVQKLVHSADAEKKKATKSKPS